MVVLRIFADLTKFGIVVFVLLTAIAGYGVGFQIENGFDVRHFLTTIIGLYFLSSGSLALNQVQERTLDMKMDRTKNRPVASGKIKPLAALILSLVFIFVGWVQLNEASTLAGTLGLLSFLLYNGLYTLWMKPRWIFAAVPGALPGALPVTIGFSAVNSKIFSSESIYLFLILFLWQMPHFWCLAMRFKDDYAKGGIPTLPVSLGTDRTLYQIGLYTFVYAGVAVASPWFLQNAGWLYLFLVLPMAFMLVKKFLPYMRSKGEAGWFSFFMWTNMSLLVFIFVPLVDKWSFLISLHRAK